MRPCVEMMVKITLSPVFVLAWRTAESIPEDWRAQSRVAQVRETISRTQLRRLAWQDWNLPRTECTLANLSQQEQQDWNLPLE